MTSLLLAGMLSACGGLKKIPESQLIPGYYEFKQPGERFRKVYVDVDHDSVTIVSTNQTVANPTKQSTDQLFLKRSFDVDVLITPFEYSGYL